MERVQGCHELGFFTFFSLLFYKTYTHYFVQVLILSSSPHSLLSISSSHFVSDHQENKERSVLSLNATKEHYKYNGQPVSTCTAMKTTGYLIVWQDNRTRDPFQDQRVSTVTHQQAHQGIPFYCIQRNTELQSIE